MSLRDVLLAFGVALLLAALLATAAALPLAVPLALIGATLVLGILFERSVYKKVDERRPGPQWQASDERFIDPATGEAVTVFVEPATGERRYVRSVPTV
jgi:membrane protein implicated in regulation of membrane protease activity